MSKAWKQFRSKKERDLTYLSSEILTSTSGRRVALWNQFLISLQSLYRKLRCLIQGDNLAESLLRLKCWEAALLFFWKCFTASPYFKVRAADDLWLSMSATPPEIKYFHFTDKELTSRGSKSWVSSDTKYPANISPLFLASCVIFSYKTSSVKHEVIFCMVEN